MEKFLVALKKKFPDAVEIKKEARDEISVRIGDEFYEQTYYFARRDNKLVHVSTLTVDAA